MKRATIHTPGSSIETKNPSVSRSLLVRLTAPVALGLYLLSASAPAGAQVETADEKQAQIHFEAARSHYNAARYEQAAAEFELAYKYSPKPALIFNAYLAYRDAENLQEAIRTLRAFLQAAPDAPNRPNLEVQLGKLEQQLQAQRQPRVAEPEEATQEAPGAETDAAEPGAPSEPETLFADEPVEAEEYAGPAANVLPYAVGGAGLALLVGATVTGVLALDAESELESSCDEQKRCLGDLSDTEDRGRTLATVTDVLLVTGILAVGTGVALYFLLPGETESVPNDAPVASLGCTSDGCGASIQGRF